MNNYIFSQDPLLFQRTNPIPMDDEQLRTQLEHTIHQYQMLQNQNPTNNKKDILGEFDIKLKTLDENTLEILSNNDEYVELNNGLQQMIQEELIKSIRWKINSNQTAIQKINRMTDIITDVTKEVELEEKRNMSELNDYIKNYSNITFDEYKKIKAGKHE